MVHLSSSTTGLGNLNSAILGNLWLGCPPLDEQTGIARFLDHADRRIQRYIRGKKKLIALLNEQKQAIIHQAVTRGLDPNVRLKPSGVEWLGDVPEHWEVCALKRHWSVTDCKHQTVPFVDVGIPLASVRETQTFDLDLANANRTIPSWYEVLVAGDRAPRPGDLIYCRNVSVGASAFVDTPERFAMGQDVCLIRSEDQNQRYLNYFLHSPVMRRQLALILVGSTFSRINVSEIKGLVVVAPPLAEQTGIADHLDEALQVIGQGIERARRAIDLLHEFRTRLISDVVTGKLDVREAAASLPAEADDMEPLDDIDAELGDAEIEDPDIETSLEEVAS